MRKILWRIFPNGGSIFSNGVRIFSNGVRISCSYQSSSKISPIATDNYLLISQFSAKVARVARLFAPIIYVYARESLCLPRLL